MYSIPPPAGRLGLITTGGKSGTGNKKAVVDSKMLATTAWIR
jgi:hypothetical protein